MRLLLNTSIAILALGTAFSPCITAQTPVELGKVKWGRDLEAAKKKSAATGKPVFVQFQEVPG